MRLLQVRGYQLFPWNVGSCTHSSGLSGRNSHVLPVQDYQVGNSPVVGVVLLRKCGCLGPVVMACFPIVNYVLGTVQIKYS